MTRLLKAWIEDADDVAVTKKQDVFFFFFFFSSRVCDGQRKSEGESKNERVRTR